MSLLERLVKKGIQDTVSDVSRRAQNAASRSIGNAVENAVTNSLGKVLGSAIQTPNYNNQQGDQQAPAYNNYNPAPAQSYAGNRNVVKLNKQHRESFVPEAGAIGSMIGDRGSAEYFADVIQNNVPGAQVRTNVPLCEVTMENPAKQVIIDDLVFINGIPKLAILIPEKTKYRNYPYLNTMNACENVGIAAIRFMKEFRNDPGYVSARVKAVIR